MNLKLKSGGSILLVTALILCTITPYTGSYAADDDSYAARQTEKTNNRDEATNKKVVIGIPCIQQINCSIPEAENILKEAYAKINTIVQFIYLPAARDIAEANSGTTDGTAFRTKSAIEKFNNLVAIDMPLFKLQFTAFYARNDMNIKSINDINNYSVGILRGSIILDEKLKNSHTQQVVLMDSIDQGLRMVLAGRVDLFLVEDTPGSEAVKQFRYGTFKTCRNIDTAILYHVVNKKKAELIPGLTAAFADMVRDGTFKRLAGRFADQTIP